MKKFGVILEYELLNYIKNKSYMISTIIIAVVIGAIMFVPSIFDLSDLLGTGKNTDISEDASVDISDENDSEIMLIFDKSGAFTDLTVLEGMFDDVLWKKADSEAALKADIENNEAAAGFIVNSLTSYEYCVYNKSMSDYNREIFEQALVLVNQMIYCTEHNIDFTQISAAFSPVIESEINILGKDMTSNYWYCYMLVILVFMIIILYGVMVATAVTQEKSNRTIEVLVTSVDTNILFFGKVIAGTAAALFQVGIIMAIALISYKINYNAWGGALDIILNIPSDVLVTFGFFGLGGLLFYIFIYGAVGALVSKTEDINKSAGSVQLIIMIVYMVVLTQLTNIDGILIKVASFLPISSYSAMFARVAMGTVAAWEVVLSFVILVVSTIIVGIIGAKIYRMGTLRYGNPIKLINALKLIKQEK